MKTYGTIVDLIPHYHNFMEACYISFSYIIGEDFSYAKQHASRYVGFEQVLEVEDDKQPYGMLVCSLQ